VIHLGLNNRYPGIRVAQVNRRGQHGNNMIDKVADFEAVLKDPRASPDQRVEPLKFLVHQLETMQ
jgi:hypothetical protein